MKNKQMLLFLIFYPLSNLINNLVHPVTPAYIQMMKMPDYMFGVLFSAMSLAGFFSSPFWGETSDRIGRVKVMRICLLGYAIGQLGFSTIKIPWVIIACRLFAGAFSSGFIVTSLAYATDITTGKERAKCLSYLAALYTLTTSLGYFIGGIIGSTNIFYSFRAQIILLFVQAIFWHKFLPESLKEENKRKDKFDFKKTLKIIDIKQGKEILTLPLIIFFIGVILTEFIRIGFTNNFNYYMKATLNLNPKNIGIIMGVIGLIGLITNLSFNSWLIRKYDTRKAFPLILFINAFVGILLVVTNKNMNLFLGVAILFATINAIYLPIQQALFTEGQKENYGLLSGYFNSSKSLGMVSGALIGGFLYQMKNIYPFIAVTFILFLASILYYINYYQFKKLK